MSCSNYQDELLLCAGREQLPEDLQDHLNRCASCRAFWAELQTALTKLGCDDDLVPDNLNVDEFVSGVCERIELIPPRQGFESRTQTKSAEVTWIGWHRYLSAAAGILLVAGITLIGSWQSKGLRVQVSDDVQVTTESDASTAILTLYEGEVDQFDEDMLDIILYDFGDKGFFEASELLLYDLSDEELQFLEDNFDVGDIL